MAAPALSDTELIRRIRQGDRSLFGQLAEKYYDEIFRYCYYRTGNEQAAYDCTQETFLHLLRFLEHYQEKRRFKAWLFQIALNVCRDYFRQETQSPLSNEAVEELLQQEDHAEGSEQRLMVQNALSSLPDFQQEVLILYFYHGYKLREIAHITGASLSTVKSRLHQAIGKLRKSNALSLR